MHWRLAALLTLALAAAVPVRAAENAGEDEPEREGSFVDAVVVGARGEIGRAANQRGYSWGATFGADLFSNDKARGTRFRYAMELGYQEDRSRLQGAEGRQDTRVRTFDIRYAKVSLLSLLGFDIEERLRMAPYGTAGAQYVASREQADNPGDPDEDIPPSVDRVDNHFWAPTWGAGVELYLSERASLEFDYQRNAEAGNRRIERFSLELRYKVWGDPEE